MNFVTNEKKRDRQMTIINVIIKLTSKLDLRTEDLQEIIEKLELLAVVVTGHRTWYVYKLLEDSFRIPKTVFHLKAQLVKTLHEAGISAKIATTDFDGKYISSIAKGTSPKKKGIRPRFFKPTIFLFDPTTEYFFCTKLLPNDTFSSSFCKSLGYKDFKYCKLSGKNLNDLRKLLHVKEHGDYINFETPELYSPRVNEESSGINFSRTHKREKYVDKIYGKVPLKLQKLTFKIQDFPCVTEKMQGEKISGEMKLLSSDVIGLIKELIQDQVIDAPPPDYIKDVLTKGKNIFQARK